MALDFSEFFKKYEAIIGEADQVFNTVRAKFSDNVRCEKGCSDCCHALFDLTLVEALRINALFNKKFSGLARTAILERADEADRAVHKLKRDAHKAMKEGANASEILKQMAAVRVRCPLLNDEGLCEMYEARPVTCRIYGVPTAIGGEAHICGKSAFEKGKPYPTVYLDRIQDRLYALSHELAATLNSRYKGLGELLVPLSLALMTDYSEEYLGVGQAKPEPAAPEPTGIPGVTAEMLPKTAPAKAPARPTKPIQGPMGAKGKAGKGLAECSGCNPESKGGCSGCSPKSFTIGVAEPRPRKAAAPKAAAKKPAAKKTSKKSEG